MSCESDSSCIFLIAGIIISDPIHHLYEDILTIHQLVIIPFGSIIKILLHKICIGLNIGDFKIQVHFELFQVFSLTSKIFVYT